MGTIITRSEARQHALDSLALAEYEREQFALWEASIGVQYDSTVVLDGEPLYLTSDARLKAHRVLKKEIPWP